MKKLKVVVIGGGTGTYTLLRGLRPYTDRLDLTAIVTMADSGGSSGRLRDEFGQLPVGDVRQALAALAPAVDRHDELLRELFLYRFSRGEGLSGHNFGNLFLTALTDIVGSETEAISTAARLLRIEGQVIPVTTDDVQLVATYDDGVNVTGEHAIDVPKSDRYPHRIVRLGTVPVGQANPVALAAIKDADVLILGPGDLYTSLLANCVITGVAEAIQATAGRLYYVANLMSRRGQTTGMQLSDYITAIVDHCGRVPDRVILHQGVYPAELVSRYREEGSEPVTVDKLPSSVAVVAAPIVSTEPVVVRAGDAVPRSLIRHDSARLAAVLVSDFTSFVHV